MCKNRTADNREVVTTLSVLCFVDARGFIFRGQPQPDGVFQGQGQDSRAEGRIGENAERADRLSPQLVETAAVEQPWRHARHPGDSSSLRRRKQPHQQGARETSD